jgi:hypothetical protein
MGKSIGFVLFLKFLRKVARAKFANEIGICQVDNEARGTGNSLDLGPLDRCFRGRPANSRLLHRLLKSSSAILSTCDGRGKSDYLNKGPDDIETLSQA